MSYLAKAVVLTALLLTVGAALGGCRPSAENPAQDRSLKRVVLRDVHPLWGGRNLYLFGDGRLFVQKVERGGEETSLRSQRQEHQCAS